MNKNIVRLTISAVTAILLLTTSISASAKIVACWKGLAYESNDGGENWTHAGGCAGGPWVIETNLAMNDEGTGLTDGEVFERVDEFVDNSVVMDRNNLQVGTW